MASHNGFSQAAVLLESPLQFLVYVTVVAPVLAADLVEYEFGIATA